jgi:hypothetical protein
MVCDGAEDGWNPGGGFRVQERVARKVKVA